MATDGSTTKDIMDRDLSSLVTSLDALKSILADTKTTIEQKLGGGTPDPSGLGDLLQKVIKGFGDVVVEQEKFAKKVIDTMKNVDTEKVDAKNRKKSDKRRLKEEEKLQKKIQDLQFKIGKTRDKRLFDKTEALIRQKQIELGSTVERAIDELMSATGDALTDLEKKFRGLSENDVDAILRQFDDLEDKSGRVASNVDDAEEAMRKFDRAVYDAKTQMRMIGGYLQSFEGALGLETFKTAFADVYETERKFTQEMRQIAFETAGVTKESFSLQRAYENIGSTVKATGVDRTKFQESYRKALKGGMKDLKQAVAMTSTQLNTEKQLGLEAGSLQENFQSFAQSGRMTNNQIADMGRGMRQVARSTGLTGEALKGVVESSMQFIDQMRKAATLSAAASKNIIELGANAKKLGVEDEMNKLRTGLSSSTSLLTEAAGETQSLIFLAAAQVGRVQDAMNGTLLRSKEGIKDFAKGMKGILRGFGVDSLEAIDQLSDEAKRVLNLQLKATVGMELGAFRSVIESYEEAGKSLGERLDSINKKMGDNLTISERNALVEEQRALKTAKQLEVLTVLDEAAKGAQSMDQALAKFGERRKEFEGDLKTLGIDFQNDADVIKGSLEGAVKDINTGLKKAGKSELKIDSSEIEKAVKDPAAFRELTSKIVQGEKELATAQKAQLDPLTQTNQTLTEINDGIRNLSQTAISNLMTGMVGQFLMIAGVLSGLGAFLANTIVHSVADLYEDISKLVVDGKYSNSLLKNIEVILEGISQKSIAPPPLPGQNTPAPPQPPPPQNTPAPPPPPPGQNTPAPPPPPPGQNTTNPPGLQQPPAKTGAMSGIGDMFDPAMGKDLAKAAVAILALSVGIVALGAAIVFLADKVMASFDLDMNKVMQTAQLVGAIAMAGGAIAAAGVAAFIAMTGPEANTFIGKIGTDYKQFLAMAAAILVLGPAMVALGGAVVGITSWILSKIKIDANRVMEVAGVVAALGAAAAGIITATFQFMNLMDQNKRQINRLIRNKRLFMKYMYEGGVALVALSIGIVALAAAIVKASQIIFAITGLDPATADKVANHIAHLFGAVAVIAVAVTATAAALVGLGLLATFLTEPISGSTVIGLMLGGAAALLALSVVMPLLAYAVVKFAGAAASFVSTKDAWQSAENVGKLLGAAGAIALGVLGAAAGLAGLGMLGADPMELGLIIAAMTGGAVALLILTPAITFLAAAVIKIADGAMAFSDVDPVYAAQVGETFGAIMMAAGKIALGVLAATAALGYLGALMYQAPYVALAVAGGAVALYFLVDPVLRLASAIIELTGQLLGNIVSVREAEKTGEAISAIFAASGTIAYEISKAMGYLSLLSLLTLGTLGISIALMYGGAAALMTLVDPTLAYIGTILDLSQQIKKRASGIDPEKEGKRIQSLFEMAATITKLITDKKGGLASIQKYSGWFTWLAGFVSKTKISDYMESGIDALKGMGDAVVKYIEGIMQFSKDVRSKLGNTDKAAIESAKSIIDVLKSVGDVAGEISKAKDFLIGLQFGDWTQELTRIPIIDYSLNPVISRMKQGALLIPDMGSPISTYIQAIFQFVNNVKTAIGGKDPQYVANTAKATVDILTSVGQVGDILNKVKSRLLALYSEDWWAGYGEIARRMGEGTRAFREMSVPIPGFVLAVTDLADTLKNVINEDPRTIAERAQNFISFIDSTTKMTERVMELKPLMLKMAAMAGVAGKSNDFVKKIDQARINLLLVRTGIVNFARSTMSFMTELDEVMPSGALKKNIATLEDASKALSTTAKVFNQMQAEILPTLGKTRNVTQLNAEMTTAETNVKTLLPKLKNFVTTFQTEISKTKALTADHMHTVNQVEKLNKMISSFGDMMKSLSTDAFSDEKINAVKLAVERLQGREIKGMFKNTKEEGYFKPIMDFVRDTFLKSMGELPDPEKIATATKKISHVASALQQFVAVTNYIPQIFTRVDVAAPDPATLIARLDKTAEYTRQVSDFVKNKFIKNFDDFPDVDKMKNAKYALEDMTSVLSALLGAATAMDDVFNKIKKEKTDPNTNSVYSDPQKAKKEELDLRRKFESISSLIMNGVVTPVLAHFGKDTVSLRKTAEVIRNLATVAKGIPDMFKGLAEAMSMLGDKNNKINQELMLKNKGESINFSDFFKNQSKLFEDKENGFPAIMKFVDEVILGTMAQYLGKYDMVAMTATATGFTTVVSATVRIIKGLGDLMGMMDANTPEPKDVNDGTKAINKIMAFKGIFKSNFESIMKFVQEGIIDVIKGKDGQGAISKEDVQMAVSSLRPLTYLFNQLPVFFRSVAMLNQVQAPPGVSKIGNYFTNLGELNDQLRGVFKGKRKVSSGLQEYTVEFNAFEEMMKIINDEIMPSMSLLPDPKEVEDKLRKLEKLGKFLTTLNQVMFQKVAPLFINRSREDEAIIAKLGKNEELYRGYFMAIARILNEGMMGMVEMLPGPDKLAPVEEKIASSIDILDATQPLFDRLADFIKSTQDSSLTTLANNAKEVSMLYHNMYSVIWNGVYIGATHYLPDASHVGKVEDRVDASIEIMDMVAPLFKRLNEFEDETRTSELQAMAKAAAIYAPYYATLCQIISEAVNQPIGEWLPGSAELGAAANKIAASMEIMDMAANLYPKINEFEEKTRTTDLQAIGRTPIKVYKDHYFNLCQLVDEGVYEPINQWLPSGGDASKAAGQVDSSIKMMQSMSTLLQFLASFEVTTNSSQLKYLAQNKDEFVDKMKNLTALVWNGIVIPAYKYLPESASAEIQRIEQSNKLISSFKSMLENLDAFSAHMSRFNMGGLSIEGLKKRLAETVNAASSFSLQDFVSIMAIDAGELESLEAVAASFDKLNGLLSKIEVSMQEMLRQFDNISTIKIDLPTTIFSDEGVSLVSAFASVNTAEVAKMQAVVDSYDVFLDLLSSLEATMIGIANKLESISQIKIDAASLPPPSRLTLPSAGSAYRVQQMQRRAGKMSALAPGAEPAAAPVSLVTKPKPPEVAAGRALDTPLNRANEVTSFMGGRVGSPTDLQDKLRQMMVDEAREISRNKPVATPSPAIAAPPTPPAPAMPTTVKPPEPVAPRAVASGSKKIVLTPEMTEKDISDELMRIGYHAMFGKTQAKLDSDDKAQKLYKAMQAKVATGGAKDIEAVFQGEELRFATITPPAAPKTPEPIAPPTPPAPAMPTTVKPPEPVAPRAATDGASMTYGKGSKKITITPEMSKNDIFEELMRVKSFDIFGPGKAREMANQKSGMLYKQMQAKVATGGAKDIEAVFQGEKLQSAKIVPPAAPMTPEPVAPPAAPKTPDTITPPAAPKTPMALEVPVAPATPAIDYLEIARRALGHYVPEGATEEQKKKYIVPDPTRVTTVASPVSANLEDLESKIVAQRVGASAPVSKVKSEELTTIADENAEQNEKLATLIGLFEQVVEFMKPASQPNTGAAEFGGNLTMANATKMPPPRFARSTSGLVYTQPGKAVMNKGQVST